MKKLLSLLFITLLVVTACSTEDDNRIDFHVEFIPVLSVELPQSVTPGQTYEMKVNFNLPTDCHYFDGFYYMPDGNTRTVAVQTIVINDMDCATPLDGNANEQKSFNFYCSPGYQYDSYLFKFYQGEDAQGQDQFLEVVVPIVQ
jgi:hypothetical protein